MIYRKTGLLILALMTLNFSYLYAETTYPAEVEQQINDFSLSGYGEKGKKTWDIAGKSANIFTDVVKLNEITGNMYGEKENIKLTADRGEFNKAQNKVH